MEVKEQSRQTFAEFARAGAFSRVVVTMNQDSGRWAVFGVSGGAAVFVEKARGGVREWSNLDRLADFCKSIGVARFEVHDASTKTTGQGN